MAASPRSSRGAGGREGPGGGAGHACSRPGPPNPLRGLQQVRLWLRPSLQVAQHLREQQELLVFLSCVASAVAGLLYLTGVALYILIQDFVDRQQLRTHPHFEGVLDLPGRAGAVALLVLLGAELVLDAVSLVLLGSRSPSISACEQENKHI
ncbi:probable palmitoyltransferase ZDHHC11B [Choloepus didactylus]|uniref:probable palmitoyltransferase ZDHHC11B n=1 Tax=Choloepus didactylus TaxID=27675 RepID=UPI00189D4373|nr:probable palmitoyltransferase ZDHHC11B [Choloepus didactylus]